jgi:hypothetical protein
LTNPAPHNQQTNLPIPQVTNPAIDPLREGLVMSLESHLGARGNFLQPGPDTLPKLVLKTPVVNDTELLAIQKDATLKTVRWSKVVKLYSPTWLVCLANSFPRSAISLLLHRCRVVRLKG